jgi:hypothetical protein
MPIFIFPNPHSSNLSAPHQPIKLVRVHPSPLTLSGTPNHYSAFSSKKTLLCLTKPVGHPSARQTAAAAGVARHGQRLPAACEQDDWRLHRFQLRLFLFVWEYPIRWRRRVRGTMPLKLVRSTWREVGANKLCQGAPLRRRPHTGELL